MTSGGRINVLVPILFSMALMGFASYLGAGPFLADGPTAEALSRFAWVPSYPGAELKNVRAEQNGDQLIYRCEFHVKDDGAKVWAFYESKLKAAGFSVIGKSGKSGNSWDLYAENKEGTRSIDVNGDARSAGASIRVRAVVR